ncbi:hypothetical protein ACPDG4_15785, partial [Myroides sp. C20-1]
MNPYKINLEDTYTIEGKRKWYNMKQCLAFIQERGVAIYGHNFFMSLYQKEVFHKLIAYAIEDQNAMDSFQLAPNKGLLLMGQTKT